MSKNVKEKKLIISLHIPNCDSRGCENHVAEENRYSLTDFCKSYNNCHPSTISNPGFSRYCFTKFENLAVVPPSMIR